MIQPFINVLHFDRIFSMRSPITIVVIRVSLKENYACNLIACFVRV